MNDQINSTAPAEESLDSILERYSPSKNKLEELRSLDKSAAVPGTVISVIIGFISMHIFGAGIYLMTNYQNYVIGTLLLAVGITGMCVTKPIFNSITRKRREKIAPKIIKLSEEIKNGIIH